MKKALVLSIAALTLALSFTGCGAKVEDAANKAENQVEEDVSKAADGASEEISKVGSDIAAVENAVAPVEVSGTTWKVTGQIDKDNKEVDISSIPETTYSFKSDGTVEIKMGDVASTAKWAQDEAKVTITAEGQTSEWTVAGEVADYKSDDGNVVALELQK